MNTAFDIIGNDDLSAWRVEDGVCWIQSRQPVFTNLLRKRSDCRLVAWSVTGAYLRTFEIKHPLRFVRQLLRRYIADLTAANERFGQLPAHLRPDLAATKQTHHLALIP